MAIRIRFSWLVAVLIIVGIVWGLKGLGYAAAALLLLPIVFVALLFIALAIGAWLLKRRMQRKMAEFQQQFQQAQAQAEADHQAASRRSDAIDVDGQVKGDPPQG